jgi:large subunit ribosomal protein L18
MDKAKHKVLRRKRRHTGIRKRVEGLPTKPRLAIYKSLNHMYAQVIDDLAGKTLAAASTLDDELKGAVKDGKTGNSTAAAAVGALVAKRAKAAGVSTVQFDRAGFKFHGRVKALADAARKEGLKF